ncbi:B3 domain-containing protein REM16 isoform X1 [Rhodamnia argentea]|uniref:B3 domain-containing protein REM16 isoform X1 n=1 Tax=Rhodamnia argentea TaxID=178133 RepID=A0ABM3GZ88_9MYRT|nr:B3 domain-containing protein REM16 isoform X1 [Rhodamnia argentea]
MEGTCKECRSWEEEIYWTHFHSIHFCQFLHGDFHQQLVSPPSIHSSYFQQEERKKKKPFFFVVKPAWKLKKAIPKKFAENLRSKLPENVVLKGPSGATWTVGTVADDENLLFKHGWQDFVKDHALEKNDILVFRYNGESSFNVLVFNQHSLCEKEAAYFHKRCSHKPMDKECGTKRKLGDSAVEAVHTPASYDVKRTLTEDPWKDGTVTVADCNILSQAKASENLVEVGASGKPHNKKKATPKKKVSVAFDCLEEKPDSTPKALFIGSRGSPVYTSNRRPVTEEEESSAFKLARAAASSDSFLVVMRPTHVYKRFYLSIPTDWATTHMDRRNQDLILRVGEGTWRARYRLTGRGSGGLSSGWKNFALENNLEQSDVCLFELANSIAKNIVLDVTIFRVVEDVVPLTLVTSFPV